MAERNAFEDFTEAERAIITDIHRREFQGMTAEEVALYAEWVALESKLDASVTAQRQALELETREKLAQHQATEQATVNAIKDMAAAAVARLETITNGQA